MPMRSQAQRAYLHIHHPEIAAEFERHTPKGVKLPKRLHAKKKTRTKSAAIQQLDEILEITQNPFYRAVNDYCLPFGAQRKHASDDRLCAATQPAFIDLGPAPGVRSGDARQLGSICIVPNQANDPIKSAQLNHSTRAGAASIPDLSNATRAGAASIPDTSAAGASPADSPLAKLAAILSPSLAALFGREQTAYVPQSIQGTYLDPNTPQEQPNAGQEAMQQNLQANLPPGAAQPGAAPAQPGAASPGAASPAGPQTAQGAAVPGLPGQNAANPIDQHGPIGGSAMGGLGSMQHMMKGAAVMRNSVKAASLHELDRAIETALRHAPNWQEQVPGGLAAGKAPVQFPAGQLQMGQKTEREHTTSPAAATEIAMDHLQEDPKYYSHLQTVEEKVAAPRTFDQIRP